MAYIDPIAFRLGPFAVRWYGLIIGLALLLGFLLALREAGKRNIDKEFFFDLIIFMVPAAILGARLVYVFSHWSNYRYNLLSIFRIWEGGLSIHGAIAGGFFVTLIMCLQRGERFWRVVDILAPSLVLGQALGRIGNFFNQEAYGYPTELPWGIYIAGAYRHPTFFYEAFWNLLVFIFLLHYRGRTRIEGRIFWAYLGLYSLGRFIIEAFRVDSVFWGPFRAGQLVSLLLIIATFYFFQKKKRLWRY